MKLLAILVIGLPVLLLLAGQLGVLRGKAPSLGVSAGRLSDVARDRWNAVSSQAGTPYHRIDPIPLARDPAAAFARLRQAVRQLPGARIVEESDTYLRAECETRVLRFVDDLELSLDGATAQVRSASRLGRKDFGVNRARVEALRSTFLSPPGAS